MRNSSLPIALSLLALLVASCEMGPLAPTAPSTLPFAAHVAPPVAEYAEYWVTLADETAPPAGEPEPQPAPGAGPWSPGPPPAAPPGVPIPTPPTTDFRVRVTIDPEPVPYSGQPIADVSSCGSLRHTWFYDQIVQVEAATGVTIQVRENFFDGRFVNRNTEKIWIPGNGTAVLKTRWCSGYPVFHYTQTLFTFTDDAGGAFTVSGPWVRLQAP
jgi:hypothetical protein